MLNNPIYRSKSRKRVNDWGWALSLTLGTTAFGYVASQIIWGLLTGSPYVH